MFLQETAFFLQESAFFCRRTHTSAGKTILSAVCSGGLRTMNGTLFSDDPCLDRIHDKQLQIHDGNYSTYEKAHEEDQLHRADLAQRMQSSLSENSGRL